MTDSLAWRDALTSAGVSEEATPTSGLQETQGGVLVPAMTEEEVSASTASRGKKMVLVVPPPRCSNSDFKKVMSISFMLYMAKSEIPSAYEVSSTLMVPVEHVTYIMQTPQFRRAMLIRGVDFSPTATLSHEQDMAIAIMSAPGNNKTFEQRLKIAGVAPSKWRAWLKQKQFRTVWDAMGGTVLKDYETDMLNALVGNAINGDTTAIKFALEVSGRHAPQRQQNVDATIVIAQLIEIVQEEVKDTAILQRIAARMQMVGSTPAAQGVVQQGNGSATSRARAILIAGDDNDDIQNSTTEEIEG